MFNNKNISKKTLCFAYKNHWDLFFFNNFSNTRDGMHLIKGPFLLRSLSLFAFREISLKIPYSWVQFMPKIPWKSLTFGDKNGFLNIQNASSKVVWFVQSKGHISIHIQCQILPPSGCPCPLTCFGEWRCLSFCIHEILSRAIYMTYATPSWINEQIRVQKIWWGWCWGQGQISSRNNVAWWCRHRRKRAVEIWWRCHGKWVTEWWRYRLQSQLWKKKKQSYSSNLIWQKPFK